MDVPSLRAKRALPSAAATPADVVLRCRLDAGRRALTSRPAAALGSAVDADSRPDRNLALELVRVTEAAAMGAGRWIGRGDKIAADQAAVDAMRAMLDTVAMEGVVVIGEGEKDEAPMLYNGERVGDGRRAGGRRRRRPARGDAADRARSAERDRRDRGRRARLDVLPGRGRLHGEDRGRRRRRRRDRHQRDADRERERRREGEGRPGDGYPRRRARARPARAADRRAAAGRRARQPDPRRRCRAGDRGRASRDRRRPAVRDRRHARGRDLRRGAEDGRRRHPGEALAAERRRAAAAWSTRATTSTACS